MKTKLLACFFALVVLAQLWVPVSMIITSENALKKGKSFKFRTAPVDPYDAFRGKFVSLEFKAATIDSSDYSRIVDSSGARPAYGKKLYAAIEEDSCGFATIAKLHESKPAHNLFIPVTVIGSRRSTVRVSFPFTKYFLEEGKAKQAEQLYRQQNRSGKQDCYAIVRVGINGHAVIEDLVLGGTEIMEALK